MRSIAYRATVPIVRAGAREIRRAELRNAAAARGGIPRLAVPSLPPSLLFLSADFRTSCLSPFIATTVHLSFSCGRARGDLLNRVSFSFSLALLFIFLFMRLTNL